MAVEPDLRNNIFFSSDGNFNIHKNQPFFDNTDNLYATINKDIVHIDSKAYIMFFDFRRKVNDLYQDVMWNAEYGLFELSQDIVESCIKDGIDVMNTAWVNLIRTDEEEKRYEDLKIIMKKSEKIYIYKESELIKDLNLQLEEHYLNTIDELDY